MKNTLYKSSKNPVSGTKTIALAVVLLCGCCFSHTAFSQDDIPLVPEDEIAVPGAAPPTNENEGAVPSAEGFADTNQNVSESSPSADELEGQESLAPQAEGAGDEFSFDDNVQYEKTSDQIADGFRKQAFEGALQNVLPLKPEEIRSVLEHYDRTIEATELPVRPYPKAELTVQNISLDPGSPPVVIKLAYGYVTTLNMLDQSGAPWAIDDISWVGDFEVQEDAPKEGTNMIRISPSTNFAHGNLSMRLKDLNTPVILTFETNSDVVYYRVDAIVQHEGPNTQAPLIDPGPVSSLTLAAGDVDMSLALSGVIPDDAQRLSVSGVDGRTSAYMYNGLTYVRTPLTLLSPGWESSVSSADGTRVYALQDAPVLLLSDKGKMVRAYLKEVGEPLK